MNYKVLILILVLIILILVLCNKYFKTIVNELFEPNVYIDEIKNNVKKAFPHLSEYIDNTNIEPGKKSYTLNKKTIRICTKDENGEYYDRDILTHVLIHELAHVLCDEHGHTKKWAEIDRYLQNLAKEKNIISKDFNPYDYPDYCNHTSIE